MCSLLTMFNPAISGSVASVTLSARAPLQSKPEAAVPAEAPAARAVNPPRAPTPRRGWRQSVFALVGVPAG